MKDMCRNARFSSKIAPDFTVPIESSIESFEQSPEEVLEENDNEVPARNKRRRIAKSFGDDFIVHLMDDTPTSITEAYVSPDADDWKEAVRSEMDSILSNGT
jgi:asparagine synthetase A